MAKMECPNCAQLTPVIPPDYRCKFCKYPLNKEQENKVNINIGEDSGSQDVDPDKTIHEELLDDGGINIDLSGMDQQSAEPLVQAVQESTPPHIEAEPDNDSNDGDGTLIKSTPSIQNDQRSKDGEIVAGWLIVHTEEKDPVYYNLYVGENFFGTEAEGYKVDIPIHGDRYVSRSHANIQVSKDFTHRFHYELLDDGSRRPQGPSLNGTYVNGNSDRLPQDSKVFLQDGDTIQVGETKLVFKTTMESHDVEEAATSVLNTDYTATVILSK